MALFRLQCCDSCRQGCDEGLLLLDGGSQRSHKEAGVDALILRVSISIHCVFLASYTPCFNFSQFVGNKALTV